MEKVSSSTAIILTKRAEIREAIRQGFKASGLKSDEIYNATAEREFFEKLEASEYAMLVLDWEYMPELVCKILSQNRKASRFESHPVFLLSSQDSEQVLALAKEFFIHCTAVGSITVDSVRTQIKDLVRHFQNVSPVRKMLMVVEEARAKGETTQAIEILEKLIAMQPDNQRVVIELAESYIQNGDWEKAEDSLIPLLQLPSCHARIKHLYARCRLKDGDQEAAIEALKDAQLISPLNSERLLELGEIYLQDSQLKEAEATFDQVLQFAPGSSAAKVGKGTSKLLQGEVNEAVSLLSEFTSPRELCSVFNTAAILATRQNNLELAISLYQRALAIPNKQPQLSSRIYYNMGIGYWKSAQGEKSLKCFERSIELDANFSKASHNVRFLKNKGPELASAKVSNQVPQAEAAASLGQEHSMELSLLEVNAEAEEGVELDDLLSDSDKI